MCQVCLKQLSTIAIFGESLSTHCCRFGHPPGPSPVPNTKTQSAKEAPGPGLWLFPSRPESSVAITIGSQQRPFHLLQRTDSGTQINASNLQLARYQLEGLPSGLRDGHW
ncbi:Uncharacterized protein HZ326_26266 [Fusarium oxysporum f. sp. albedinis]|nr:Uncharacterized protein HZ326_26266 [Fusarium oxysporum f. sp. albedinis]